MGKEKKTDNLALWDSVCKTDPAMTKQVNQRGGFTAICAQWQVMQATKQFGPVGSGWGYTVAYSVIASTRVLLQAADVTLWWMGNGEKNSYGPIRGINTLINIDGRVDDDAGKKAMTDGLTKALSHLGFSADVFLGKYDDNKYVAELEKEFGGEKKKHPMAEKLEKKVSAPKQPDDTKDGKTIGEVLAEEVEKVVEEEEKISETPPSKDYTPLEKVENLWAEIEATAGTEVANNLLKEATTFDGQRAGPFESLDNLKERNASRAISEKWLYRIYGDMKKAMEQF